MVLQPVEQPELAELDAHTCVLRSFEIYVGIVTADEPSSDSLPATNSPQYGDSDDAPSSPDSVAVAKWKLPPPQYAELHADEAQYPSKAAPRPTGKPQMPLSQEILFVMVVCSAQLFGQASLGQTIPILKFIGPTFGGLSAGQSSWIPAAFSLTTGTFIVIAGRVGDMIGHKPLFIFGWVWTAIWSLLTGLSAFSREQIFFDVCRGMQGIGSAVLIPSALAILGRTYRHGRRKAMVFAIFGAMGPNGFHVGALFAIVFAEWAWWPWSFWLMAIFSLIFAALSIYAIPSAGTRRQRREPQSFDYLGAATGVTGLVLFNVAWNQAPVVGWKTPYVIALLILGSLFLVAFLVVENRVHQPLIPMSGLSSKVGYVLGCIALGSSGFGIFLYYLWQFLESLCGEVPLLALAQLWPMGVAGVVAALVAGKLLTIVRPELLMLMALCAYCAGNVIVATMQVGQSYWTGTFLAIMIMPFGIDLSYPAATFILSNSVSKQHQGIAASLVVTVVNYSMSIGMGIGATAQSQVDGSGDLSLQGLRAAMYSGVGLASCGILLATTFVIYSSVSRRRRAQQHACSDKTVE